MKWAFCQCCFRDGHCENQDRGHKCETYPKQLEDKVERLQKQLEIARIVLGQIAMFSSDKTDAVQCAKAIKDMSEVEK